MTCALCGMRATERHHVFGGPNRKHSEAHGFTVLLCSDCHRGTYGIHGKHGATSNLRLKRQTQKLFEDHFSREEFLRIIGRSYL